MLSVAAFHDSVTAFFAVLTLSAVTAVGAVLSLLSAVVTVTVLLFPDSFPAASSAETAKEYAVAASV